MKDLALATLFGTAQMTRQSSKVWKPTIRSTGSAHSFGQVRNLDESHPVSPPLRCHVPRVHPLDHQGHVVDLLEHPARLCGAEGKATLWLLVAAQHHGS